MQSYSLTPRFLAFLAPTRRSSASKIARRRPCSSSKRWLRTTRSRNDKTDSTADSDAWKPKPPALVRQTFPRKKSDPRWPHRIVPGDLAATLETHRDANRASVIRRTSGEASTAVRIAPNKRTSGLPRERLQAQTHHDPQNSHGTHDTDKAQERAAQSARLDNLIELVSNKSTLSEEDVSLVGRLLTQSSIPMLERPRLPRTHYVKPWVPFHSFQIRTSPLPDGLGTAAPVVRPWLHSCDLSAVDSMEKR